MHCYFAAENDGSYRCYCSSSPYLFIQELKYILLTNIHTSYFWWSCVLKGAGTAYSSARSSLHHEFLNRSYSFLNSNLFWNLCKINWSNFILHQNKNSTFSLNKSKENLFKTLHHYKYPLPRFLLEDVAQIADLLLVST